MARMRSPDLASDSSFDWDTDFKKVLKTGPKNVFSSSGVPVPASGPKYGGITYVPYLNWMLAGGGDVVIGERGQLRRMRTRPGTVILHAPDSFTRIYHDQPGRFLRITFDTDHILCGISHCLDHRRLDDPDAFPPLDAFRIPHAMDNTGNGLIDLILNTPGAEQSARRSWLQALLWQVHGFMHQQNVTKHSQGKWVAMRAWLEEHADAPIGRQDCAHAFGVHPNHVARLFKQHGDMSFSETLLHCRMLKARQLLLHTRSSVKEIAHDCGFGDSAYFIKRFRQQFHVTPEKWRGQH